MSKKSIFIITAVVILVIAIGTFAFFYYHSDTSAQILYMTSTGSEGEKSFYVEARSVGGEVKSGDEESVMYFSEKNFEMFEKFNKNYTSPTEIYADCYIKDGKTYVHFNGSATEKETNRQTEVDELLEFDFVFTKRIINYSSADRTAIKNSKVLN